jgi:hypothetical protein
MAAEDKTNDSPDKVQSILAQRDAKSMSAAVEKRGNEFSAKKCSHFFFFSAWGLRQREKK